MSKEEIAVKLKKARESKRLKQEDVASFLGVTTQKVSSFETGRTRVDVDTLAKLCELYGIDVNFVLGIKKTQSDTWQPTITEKDKRDIAKEVDDIIGGLSSSAALSFDADDIDDETRDLLRKSLENVMETARLLAKKKYTPYKYRLPKEDK